MVMEDDEQVKQEDDLLNQINFFENIIIPDTFDLSNGDDFFLIPSQSSLLVDSTTPSPESVSWWICEIEQMLFKDDVQVHVVDEDFSKDYFSDLLPDVQSDHVQEKERSESKKEEDVNEDYLSDLLLDVSADQVKVSSDVNSNRESNSSDDDLEKDRTDDSVSKKKEEEDDDPISKKRKRQMRNRDAAVRSRERKKMYVRDLEVKSKFLEGECIRLQRLLQCCAAENHALHLQLQKDKALRISRAKQESAVLLLESLLLGSLLWFLGILGLFFPLELLHPKLPADMLVNVGSNNQELVDLVALGRAKSKRIGLGALRLFFKRKRCKAPRSKMKTVYWFGAVLA